MYHKHHSQILDRILSDARNGGYLTKPDIGFLLRLTHKEDQQRLFSAARHIRERHFGRKIFLYGFIYFATYCRNDCLFCQFRKSNAALPRYEKKLFEILKTVRTLAAAGVQLVDLTMGEAPEFYKNGRTGFEKLVDLAIEVKRISNLPVMISPGVVPDDVFADLAAAGVDWYACYQETHNASLFKHLRTSQDYDLRLNKKMIAKKWGMLIEEGILTGVGESIDDIVHSIDMMRELDADQVRAMAFVPQKDTPLMRLSVSDPERELMTLSVMRLVFPDKLIPASLDVNGLEGLQSRLNVGANVITSLVVPGRGWVGVANQKLDIDEARRTPNAIKPILKKLGLRTATLEEYQNWMFQRKNQSKYDGERNQAISMSSG